VMQYRDAQMARGSQSRRSRSNIARETTARTGDSFSSRSGYYNDLQSAEDRAYARGRPWGEYRNPFWSRTRSYDNNYDSGGYYGRGDGYYGREDGRRAVTEAVLYYTVSDLVLRGLAFFLFSHAAQGYSWIALWVYLSGHTIISREFIYDGFSGIMNAIGSALIGLFPLVADSSPRYTKAETIYTTVFCAACALAALYLPGLPKLYTDSTFRALVTGFVAVATTSKLAASAYYVWPAAYGDRTPSEPGFWDELLR